MLDRLAGFVVRKSLAVLVVGLLLAVIGGVASTTLFDKLTAGGFDDPTSESSRAITALDERFGQGLPNLTLLVTSKGRVDDPSVTAAGTQLTRKLSREPGVANVSSYWTTGKAPQLRGKSGHKALIMGTVTGDDTASQKRVAELADRYQGSRDGLEVTFGGYTKFQRELLEQGQKDATTGETVAIPITLVALVFIFGSVVAAALPLAVALVAMMLTMGLTWILASVTTVGSLAASVVTLLGLGLAIDYSLLMVSRYREELRSGLAPPDAIRATLTSAGRTVTFSALTVAVSSLAMAWFPLQAVRSMGYAGALTALLSGAASLIVLPALLALLGDRIEKGRVFRRRRTAATGGTGTDPAGRSVESGFWHRLATTVMRRPVPIVTIVTAFLLLLGAPFLGINLGMPDERVMPSSSSARQVADTVRAEFDSSEQNALQVVAPEGGTDRAAVGAYAKRLSELPHVAAVRTATGAYAEGRQAAPPDQRYARFASGDAVYFAVVPETASADDADRLVGEIRSQKAPFEALVGGAAATNHDAASALEKWLPYALGTVLLTMLVLLFLVTGSVMLPFLALVLSALSLTATFGALVWVFQDGHLAGLFGDFTPTGNIAGTIPVMLFGLAFGLAMDYQVFLLSRMREEYELTGSPTAAVARGLERTGRIVTAAAVAISVVFLAFTVSGISLVKAYGIGLPLAVLMDATLIRGAVLPAAMRLGGRATWWAPAPLRRLHSRYGLREEPVAAAPRRDGDRALTG
ncbi:MMPL family transporter [Streptomyces sp. 11-1-2]|uniref:MMPL family transporter n=1 Tax=unclassified Streptomyces TaxID=2593676 RepID=UPI000B8D976D|nr:MMPL family transporter [Streptomyces sp. 11-1-2]ASQ93716.1 transporter [Streptomyces sp. 11-1-2]